MKKIISITFCLLYLLIFSTSKVNACSCGLDTDTKSIFSRSGAVFIGKVLKVETVKEAGLVLPFKETSDGLKPARWEKETRKVQSVTFQVTESFKGTIENTFTVTSPVDSCFKIAFVTGRSYLVLARKIRPQTIKEIDESYEKRLKDRVNKFNQNLSFYRTDACDLTYNLESRENENELQEIRNFLKNGVWSEPKETP